RRHTRFSRDWSSDVCSSDLTLEHALDRLEYARIRLVHATRLHHVHQLVRDPDIAVADVAVLVRVGMARVIHERPFRAVGRDAFDRHTDRRLLRLAGQRDLTGAHTRNDLAGNDLWWRVARHAPWRQLHH